MTVDKLIKAIQSQKETGRIHIKSLEVDDVIVAETENSKYVLRITELSDAHHILEVSSNNKKYSGPYQAILRGTTVAPGTSTICPEHLAVGGNLEILLVLGKDRIKALTTSEVKRIAINGVQILPNLEAQA